MASNVEVMVDDRDPRITYTGNWTEANRFLEYNETSHGTTTTGSSLHFTFEGTSVAAFATLMPSNGEATFTVDGNNIPAFIIPTKFPLFQQLIFRSPPLQDGHHDLTITTSLNNTQQFWIDYLEYSPSASDLASMVSGSHSSSSASGNSNGHSNGNNSNANGNSHNNSSGNNSGQNGHGGHQQSSLIISKGAIAGIAVGAFVAALAMVALLFFVLRRRSRRQRRFNTVRPNIDTRRSSDVSFLSAPVSEAKFPILESQTYRQGDQISWTDINSVWGTAISPTPGRWIFDPEDVRRGKLTGEPIRPIGQYAIPRAPSSRSSRSDRSAHASPAGLQGGSAHGDVTTSVLVTSAREDQTSVSGEVSMPSAVATPSHLPSRFRDPAHLQRAIRTSQDSSKSASTTTPGFSAVPPAKF